MATEAWSRDELEASVVAYLDMLKMHQSGQKFVKIEVIRALQSGPLKNRSKGSIEKRFQNIPSVLDNRGIIWLQGYKPLSHVGKNVWADILNILASNSSQRRSSGESWHGRRSDDLGCG